MFYRYLLDNEDFAVVLGPLGGLKITLKSRQMTRKCSLEERRYFFSLIEALKKNGMPIEPSNRDFENVVEEFASAAILPGTATWRAFFTVVPPEVMADSYPGDST